MKITLIQSQVTLEIKSTTNLLALLESKGISCEYQCRSGYCGSCRVVKISGTAEHPNALATINEREILLCCARAKSDLVIDK